MMITPDSLLKLLSLIIVAIIAFLLNKFFYNRPKIVAYYGHFSRHLLKKHTPIEVFTHSVIVRNIGQMTATNVRLGHRKTRDNEGKTLDFPEISIFPEVMYSIADLPDGGKEIIFPTLVANKQITISYLYFLERYINFNTHVECNEGAAEIIRIIPTRELPSWKKIILFCLLFVGASTVLYFTIHFLLSLN
ncbi:MAG: hypothetical protein A2X78_00235 [Gammaproteobacteria bacterium GWE2_37_16]|nr:MAG: hypothetical protein A2X78_00235 [Gammaproteobacteria bacterium GWE2_37_16]